MCYFIVFDEFGFSPSILNRIVLKPYFHHNAGDVFNPNHPFQGNTNVRCQNGDLVLIDDKDKIAVEDGNLLGSMLDWLFTTDMEQDLRLGFLQNNCPTGASNRYSWGDCKVFQISPISKKPIC